MDVNEPSKCLFADLTFFEAVFAEFFVKISPFSQYISTTNQTTTYFQITERSIQNNNKNTVMSASEL